VDEFTIVENLDLNFPQNKQKNLQVTMKTSLSLFSSAVAAAFLLPFTFFSVGAQQIANDPPSYFGGSDHQSYLDWISDFEIAVKYNSSVFLPSRQDSFGAAVHWSADDDFFYVAVAARATGWIGFGLSEAGGEILDGCSE